MPRISNQSDLCTDPIEAAVNSLVQPDGLTALPGAGDAPAPVPSPDIGPVPPIPIPPMREPETPPEVTEPPLPGGPEPVREPDRAPAGSAIGPAKR